MIQVLIMDHYWLECILDIMNTNVLNKKFDRWLEKREIQPLEVSYPYFVQGELRNDSRVPILWYFIGLQAFQM